MTNKPSRRVVVDVDPRGRVSLGRFGFKSTQVVIDQVEGGGLVIHEAVALTPAEAAHYSDPKAISTLNEALRQAKDGETRALTLRSKSTA
ncbi:hypothetical protein BH23ACT4_BH23ACT4_15590 [soil metagenome]